MKKRHGGTEARRHEAKRPLAGSLALLMLLGGCARAPGVIFEPVDPPLRWPSPPEVARIHYIGALMTDQDLEPGRSFGQAINDTLFGLEPAQSMLTPFALCTDGGSRLFVCDSNAQLVHVFDLESREYERWRPDGEGATFSQPVGIAWDPRGRLLVADAVAGLIFEFDAEGAPLGTFGGDDLVRPCGLAVDPARGRVLVADAGAQQLVVFGDGGALETRVGERGVAPGQFNFPTNVAVDRDGNVYVSDSLNSRVQVFDPELRPVRVVGSRGDLPGYFSHPKGLALDSRRQLYVLDSHFEAVQVFDGSGHLLLSFGEEGHGPGQFWLPTGIFIDVNDRIWIADSYNRRVQVFDIGPPAVTEETP